MPARLADAATGSPVGPWATTLIAKTIRVSTSCWSRRCPTHYRERVAAAARRLALVDAPLWVLSIPAASWRTLRDQLGSGPYRLTSLSDGERVVVVCKDLCRVALVNPKPKESVEKHDGNPCSESDCDQPVAARGLCWSHYRAAKFAGDLPPARPARPRG